MKLGDKLPFYKFIIMKLKVYNPISKCIGRKTKMCYWWSHKNVDNLDEVFIIDDIHRKIINELCEYFNFNNENYL
jgi:hypothetical protein